MAEAANPYQAPRAEVGDASGETQPVKVFSVSGRIGRARYVAYGAVFTVLIWIIAVVLALLLGADKAWLAFIAAWLAATAIGFMLTIQRCHDFDVSGWLSLLILVPLANLVFWFIPGSRGANRWGAPTPPNSAWVIVGVCVPVIAIPVIGILAAVAIPAYQDYTYRAKISEGIVMASPWRMVVAEHYATTRRLPASVAELRKDSAPPQSEGRYGRISLGENGVLTLTLKPEMGALADRTIVFMPDATGTRWDCTAGTLAPRYRPSSCRAAR